MELILKYFRTLPQRQIVRPWALATPILVLLVALPLLRPLRSPEISSMSANELSRLATVQTMAEHHTQEIDQSSFYRTLHWRAINGDSETVELGGKHYSDKAPVLSVILAGAYQIMRWFGLSMHTNQPLVVYLLTIICSVVPVASCAGMVYRMGRLFELKRPWRTLLAATVTFGSGLLSYAVVINAHAPAAALVMAACACLVHTTVAKEPTRTGAWLMVSGFCAALAATIDPAAGIFLFALVLVIIALRWRKHLRVGGVLLYVVGAVPPILLHTVLTVPITGDMLPPTLHPEFHRYDSRVVSALNVDAIDIDAIDDDPAAPPTWLRASLDTSGRVVSALVGPRGIFSHFPVLIFGLLGIGAVLRRHWPATTKVLAAVTLLGGCAAILAQPIIQRSLSGAAFGPRWFLVFLPLLLFWSGAWLRKKHHPVTWSLAAIALVFSVTVSLLGMTAPFMVSPGEYSAGVALRQFLHNGGAYTAMERTTVATN
jgi:hypothetical protein